MNDDDYEDSEGKGKSEGDISIEIPAVRQASYELKTNKNALNERKDLENFHGSKKN